MIFHINCATDKVRIGSTFNQKVQYMDGLQNPVSGIGDGVFILTIQMKPAICLDYIVWQEM